LHGLRQARRRHQAGFSLGQEIGRQPLIVATGQRQFKNGPVAAAAAAVAAEESVWALGSPPPQQQH
jgi:hypothetical protein